MTWSYLDFKRNILPDVSGIDCSRARESAGGPVGGGRIVGFYGHLMWRADSSGKRPWCWETLRVGGEKSDRGWDGWMTSPTQWARVWAISGRQWRTGNPGVLLSMGPQRVRHHWVTQQQQIPELTVAWSGEVVVDVRRSSWVWKCIFQDRSSRLQWWLWYKFCRSGFPATCTDHPKYSYLHLAMMNYGMRFVTLYRRQGSRPSPWKRNAKKQNGCLGRPYK